jgi:hypothetical protein
MGRFSDAYRRKLARFQANPHRNDPPDPEPWRRGLESPKFLAHRKSQKRKSRKKAELRAVLAMARAAMGYKPNGRKGVKLSSEHLKAMAEGRQRYWQAKREMKP